MFSIANLKELHIEMAFAEPVKARWLALMQAGWDGSAIWDMAARVRVTINGQSTIYKLDSMPARWQAIDLGNEIDIKTFSIDILETHNRTDTIGGFAEIAFSTEQPAGATVPDQRTILHHWQPELAQAPDLHTTGIHLDLVLKQPIPQTINIDLPSLQGDIWRYTFQPAGKDKIHLELTAADFSLARKSACPLPLLFYTIGEVQFLSPDTQTDPIESVAVQWQKNDKTVFPWETQPLPVEKDGLSWWPSARGKTGGHFAFRIEPNGLLINNVSFNSLERGWYYFKPVREPLESFQFNFNIPGAIQPKAKTVVKSDTDKTTGQVINRAGIDRQYEYEVDKGAYADDKIDADGVSVRWKRNVKTAAGKTYEQELRYSILAVGVQVETNSPAFMVSFQDAQKKKGPAAVVLPTKDGVKIVPFGKGIDPKDMSENWLLLLAEDGSPEIPMLLVFQHRPDRLTWTKRELIIKRVAGMGTLAMGTPFGAGVLDSATKPKWLANPALIPAAKIRTFANLLMAYPLHYNETFAVDGGVVRIHGETEFLPWSDDWGTKPTPYTPISPLISYSVQKGYLPKDCVANVKDMDIITKWGPYWAREGATIDYSLPIPKMWDYAPLGMAAPAGMEWLGERINNSFRQEEMVKILGTGEPVTPTAGMFPHYGSHDFAAGVLRAANFLSDEQRAFVKKATEQRVLSALMPQNYRLRRDPITGATYVACTCWGGMDYDINGEGFGDIDYWQGLTMYGLYTHAKYNGMWETMRENWPVIRSLISYWEALNSWAVFGPGAREAGELYHGDMATGTYAGLVGYYKLAQQLGTPYEKALSAYLISKNAVAMASKFGFDQWAVQLHHQELGRNGPSLRPVCSGYGERYVASFPFTDPASHGFESTDPWWRTGCIGPQSGQPESQDIFVRRCYDDLLRWEKNFVEVCPNDAFITHDDVRVLPHAMTRTYLDDKLRASAADLLKKYQNVYLLRDVHVAAGLLAWDCPVRLLDWAPAYVAAARWDAKTQQATISLQANSPTTLRIAVRWPKATVRVNGLAVETKQVDTWNQWRELEFTVPASNENSTITIGQ